MATAKPVSIEPGAPGEFRGRVYDSIVDTIGATPLVRVARLAAQHGAKADVLKTKTERIEIVDARTVRFHFKEPFLDFPMIFGTSNVSGAGCAKAAGFK